MNGAARAVVVLFLALAGAALLNAQGLRKRAEIQPSGLGRTVALAVTKPLADVADMLYLDRPRRELKAAIGRSDDDTVDTTIAFNPPPPRPPSHPRPPSAAPPPPAAPPPRKHPHVYTPTRQLRIWVAGDSLAAVPGESLERIAGVNPALDVLQVESRVSTGLGRPDVYNWFQRIRAVIHGLRPRVAVLSFGADDAHNYLSGAPKGASIGPLGSPSWVAEYRRRLEGVTREFARSGAYVIWLGAPITRGEGRNRGFRVVDRVLRSVAAEHGDEAAYIDTWHMFLNRRGRYADYLPDGHGHLVQMRAGDGVHYTPAAGDMVARAVLAQLRRRADFTGWRHAG